MAAADPATTSAGELVRQLAHYSDLALTRPVIVTRNRRPRTVLLSVEEYERLKQRDPQAFLAADTPEQFLTEIEKLASGQVMTGRQAKFTAETLRRRGASHGP
jgi:PHD/YefM family antitoxin component YafN of YafNO toxin-antitoxin module